MIFVTVGTGKFESLVKEIDKIAPSLEEEVVVQIGAGEYVPKNCKYFRVALSLSSYYKKASLIITHGGPGNVFDLLDLGKKFIALANRDRTDPRHQVEYLEAISESKGFLYCKDVSLLESYIKKIKTMKFKKYKRPECKMNEYIIKFLG